MNAGHECCPHLMSLGSGLTQNYMNTQSALITLAQATLVDISRQSGSAMLNWWLMAQQGRCP